MESLFSNTMSHDDALGKALYVPWSGLSEDAAAATLSEETKMMQAALVIGNLWTVDRSSLYDETRLSAKSMRTKRPTRTRKTLVRSSACLSPEEAGKRVDIEILRAGLSEYESLSSDPDSPEFEKNTVAAGILRNSLEILEGFCTEPPTLAEIRLCTGVAALGILDSSHAVSLDVFDEIVELWKETLHIVGQNPEICTPDIAVSLLFFMAGNSAFFGHSSIFEYIEPLRHMGLQDSRSGTNGFYASAATRISFELGEMSRDALAGVFPDIGELRENILGTGTVAMMHPDFRPTSSFWLTEELFEEKIRGIFSPSFPGRFAALERLVPDWDSPPSWRASRMERLLDRFVEEDVIHAVSADSGTIISDALVGWFDSTTISRSSSAWFRHENTRAEVRVVSPLETSGFLELLDEFAESSPLGDWFRKMFVLDCMDAFSVSQVGMDLVHFSGKNAKIENPVVSDDFLAWIFPEIQTILSDVGERKISPSDVSVPLFPEILSMEDPEGVPLVVRVSETASSGGRLGFRDAVALTILLADHRVAAALGKFAEEDLVGAARRIGNLVALAAKGIFEGPPPEGEVGSVLDAGKMKTLGKGILERALETLKGTLPPEAGRFVFSAARRLLGEGAEKGMFEECFPLR